MRCNWHTLFGFVFIALGTYTSSAAGQDVVPLNQLTPGLESLQAKIDGHAGAFLFDSGFGMSAITPAMASSIGCTPWGKLSGFRATGEREDMQRCGPANLVIGKQEIHLQQLGVFDFAKFMGPLGQNTSGAIGLDAFDGKVVTLSVASHTVTVENALSAKHIAASEQEIPIRLVRDVDGAALGASMGVQTPRGMVWLEIDTGNSGPSMIDKSVASALGLNLSQSGKQMLNLSVGNAHFQGPCIVKDMIRDGNIGRSALQDWDLTLDLKQGRGWIRRSTAAPSGS